MEQSTIDSISLWLFGKREKFTLLLFNDTEIQTLPHHLTPENINLETLKTYLNFSTVEQNLKKHQHEGFYLFTIYTHVFSFIGIELSSLYQAKLFIYFYCLSYRYASSQEAWNEIIKDEERLNAIKAEVENSINN